MGDVRDIVEGDGYAVGHIDAMGEDYGFRKVRRAVGVTEFGVNAVVTPPGFGGGGHYHDEQQELYFMHRGTMEFEFGDGSTHRLGPGAVARVDAATVRRFPNRGGGGAGFALLAPQGGAGGRGPPPPPGRKGRPRAAP